MTALMDVGLTSDTSTPVGFVPNPDDSVPILPDIVFWNVEGAAWKVVVVDNVVATDAIAAAAPPAAGDVLAQVRAKYAPIIAGLEPEQSGARSHHMLDEFRGLRRLQSKANRRLLGRG